MAHPKRKSRKQEEIREERIKLMPYTCNRPNNSESHLHRAIIRRKMYYRGQVVIDATEQVEA